MTLDQLDREFARFARQKAEGVARGATWEEIDLPDDANSEAIEAWLKTHRNSFQGRQRLAARLVAERKWPEAKAVLLELKAAYPEYVGPENAYMLLAAVYKQTSDAVAENAILEELAARDGDASPAYLRLMDMDEATGNWEGVARNAYRLLAVNPLIPAPHRHLAHAAEHLDRRDEAIAAYRALSRLDDTDPAEVHYRLAKLLSQAGKRDEARREVLMSLEEAPRFLDPHQPAGPDRFRSGNGTGHAPAARRHPGGDPTMTRRRLILAAISCLLAVGGGLARAAELAVASPVPTRLHVAEVFALRRLTVEENIDFFSGIYGVPRARRAERKDYVLRMAGIEEKPMR